MNKFKVYLALIISLLMTIVILQNTEAVETRVLFMTITMPRAALLAFTLLIGLIIGFALALTWGKKSHRDSPPAK